MSTDRGGTWNLRLGKAVPKVKRLMNRHRLDWLTVQELNGQGQRLQRRLGLGFDVIASSDGDSAVVVRRGVDWGAPRAHAMGGVEWERQAGRPGLHPARNTASVRIGPRNGGYRVLSAHMPPGPDWKHRRAEARHAYMQRVTYLGRRWSARDHLGGWVMAGDWNLNRRDARARTVARNLQAQTTGVGVDWVMAHGVTVSDYRVVGWLRRWSDHRPRIFTVTR